MEYLIWDALPVDNACLVEGPENFANPFRLRLGKPLASDFPRDVLFRMSKRHKKSTRLTDDLVNLSELKVCSKRLVEFLRARKLPGLEYLPVAILDHKGKPSPEPYFIVHAVGLQPALDLERSKPRFNKILKTQIDAVAALVLDPTRIAPGVKIFRLAGLSHPVLIEKGLAAELEGAGFVGPGFLELADFE